MSWLPMYLDRPDADRLLSWLNDDEEIAFLVLAGRKARPTARLKRLRAGSEGFTFYNIGGLSPLVKVVNHWVAVQRLDALPDGSYTLWHVPSGPLPLLAANLRSARGTAGGHRGAGRSLPLREALGFGDGVIEDPWAGWTETSPGADPDRPYFGAGHPGVIDLEVETRHLRHTELADDFVTVRRRVVEKNTLGLSSFGWIGNHYRIIGRPAQASTERWWRRLRRRVQRVSTRVTRSGPLHGRRADVYAFPAALAAIQEGMARSAY